MLPSVFFKTVCCEYFTDLFAFDGKFFHFVLSMVVFLSFSYYTHAFCALFCRTSLFCFRIFGFLVWIHHRQIPVNRKNRMIFRVKNTKHLPEVQKMPELLVWPRNMSEKLQPATNLRTTLPLNHLVNMRQPSFLGPVKSAQNWSSGYVYFLK